MTKYQTLEVQKQLSICMWKEGLISEKKKKVYLKIINFIYMYTLTL